MNFQDFSGKLHDLFRLFPAREEGGVLVEKKIPGFEGILEKEITGNKIILIYGDNEKLLSVFTAHLMALQVGRNSDGGLFVSLDRDEASLRSLLDDTGLEIPGKLLISDFTLSRRACPEEMENYNPFSCLIRMVWLLKKEPDARFSHFALDSLNEALTILSYRENPDIEVIHFAEVLKDLKLTVFWVVDLSKNMGKQARLMADAVADGALRLEYRKYNGKPIASIRVERMRGNNFSPFSHELLLDSGGFSIGKPLIESI